MKFPHTTRLLLSHAWIADINFFKQLDDEDAQIAARVKAGGCLECGGRLDRADYPRKPRGGDVAAAGEVLERRRSLCCAREGCRRRTTPPSLVFLGRRVYLAVTVVLAAWRATTSSSPPARTVARWRGWFASLRDRSWWTEARARLAPAVEPAEILPAAIIERVHRPGRSLAAALMATLRIMASAS